MTKMTSGFKTKIELELEREKKKQEMEHRPVPMEWQVERYEKTISKKQEEYIDQLEQYCTDQKKKRQDRYDFFVIILPQIDYFNDISVLKSQLILDEESYNIFQAATANNNMKQVDNFYINFFQSKRRQKHSLCTTTTSPSSTGYILLHGRQRRVAQSHRQPYEVTQINRLIIFTSNFKCIVVDERVRLPN